jgi:hypothetical protein
MGGAITPMRGTRDAYNQWDYGDRIAGDQSGARSINCVDVATD